MSKVSMFAKFTPVEGKDEELDAALVGVVAASEGVEGVESYSYHRGDDGVIWFYALMSNAEVMQTHHSDPAMQAAMRAFMPLMAAPPEMATTTPIAVNG